MERGNYQNLKPGGNYEDENNKATPGRNFIVGSCISGTVGDY